jgi:ribosomal protein S18 acetylase RimI-like enzyme
MTEGFRIRRAVPADAAPLAELAARTFHEAFADGTPPDDMAAHLAKSYGVSQQSEEIADPGIVTRVAEVEGGALVAFSQIGRAPAPECVTGEAPVMVRRFYVEQAWQGRGLAQRLMAAAREDARDLGGRTLWLTVWEKNGRAIAFYRKHGFADVGEVEFWVGADCQMDRVMAAEIDPLSE